jgi:hypothetical protein
MNNNYVFLPIIQENIKGTPIKVKFILSGYIKTRISIRILIVIVFVISSLFYSNFYIKVDTYIFIDNQE